MLKLGKYIACICEGTAEQAIIDILLENDLLIFKRDDLIDEEVIRVRDAKTFEIRYLRKEYDGLVSIIRVLDSRRENFKLNKAYLHKVEVLNVITSPEIEMLVIINEGKYKEYRKSNKKPSEYCKQVLKMKTVKTYDFVRMYFKDVGALLKAIKRYDEITKTKKDEFTLKDLLI